MQGNPLSAANYNRFSLVLAFAGIFVAASLSVAHARHVILPCGASSGCEAVASDSSSYVFGIPVSIFGLVAYSILAGCAILRSFGVAGRFLRWAGLAISGAGSVASVLLTRHSIVAIGAICLWCVASAAIMCLLLVTHLALMRRDTGSISKDRASWALPAVLCAIVGLGVFATVRTLSRPAKVSIDPARLATTSTQELIPDDARSLGPSDAPVTIVEFSDLSCAACRAMHPRLMRLVGNRRTVRLVFRHLPLSMLPGHEQSRPLAVLAEASKTDEVFWKFVTQVYSAEKELSTTDVNRLSVGIDQTALAAGNQRVDRDVSLARHLRIDQTPTYVIVTANGRVTASVTDLTAKLSEPQIRTLIEP